MKKILISLLAVIVVISVVFALGPREPVEETITFDSANLGSDLDAYLAEHEKQVANIKPGAEKQIIWANSTSKQKTEWAVVYVHGFSATLQEVRPLPDQVAASLGANLYFTRLTGHGRDGDAMAEATVNDWYNDVAEALAIGRAIGERVILMSTSTGGTLISWAATKPALVTHVAGNIMISPNFGVQAAGSSSLSLPWARQLLPLIFGQERSFEPANEGQAKWWTTKYPNVALLPMQASVDRAVALNFEDITLPTLFIYHPEDKVVKSDVTREIAKRWGKNSGAKADVHEISESKDAYKHVIAGDILSPANTAPLTQKSLEWIRAL